MLVTTDNPSPLPSRSQIQQNRAESGPTESRITTPGMTSCEDIAGVRNYHGWKTPTERARVEPRPSRHVSVLTPGGKVEAT